MTTAIALLVLSVSVPFVIVLLALISQQRECARLRTALRSTERCGAPCFMALVMIRDASPTPAEAALIARTALDVVALPQTGTKRGERQ